MLNVELTAIVCVGYNATIRMCTACITERGHEMSGPVCMFNKMEQQYHKTAPHMNIVNG